METKATATATAERMIPLDDDGNHGFKEFNN